MLPACVVLLAFVLLAGTLGYAVYGSAGILYNVKQSPSAAGSHDSLAMTSVQSVGTRFVQSSTSPSSDPGKIIKTINISEIGTNYPVPRQSAYDSSTSLIYSTVASYTSTLSYLVETNVSSASQLNNTIKLSEPGYIVALDTSNGNLVVAEYNVSTDSDYVQQVNPKTDSVLPPVNMSLSSAGFPVSILYDPVNGLVYILTIKPTSVHYLSTYSPQTNLVTNTSITNFANSRFQPASMIFNSNYTWLFISGLFLYATSSYELACLAIDMSNYSYNLITTSINGNNAIVGGITFDPYDGLLYCVFQPTTAASNGFPEAVAVFNATSQSYVLTISMPNVQAPIGVTVAGTLTYDPDNHDIYLTQSGEGSLGFANNLFYGGNNTIAVLNGTSPTASNPIKFLTSSEYPVYGMYVPSPVSGAGGSLWFDDYAYGPTGPFGAFTVAGIPPVITSYSVSPSVIDMGSSVTFSASVSFGVGLLNYSYSGLPSGMVPRDASSITGTPSATGNYTVALTVTDAAEEVASATTFLAVNPPLSASIHSSALSPDAGQVVHFSMNISGGTPPYAVHWVLGDGSTATGSSILHVYSSSGHYGVTSTVEDGAGSVLVANLTETVSLPPSNLTISASSNVTDAGIPVMFSAEWLYGNSPVVLNWSLGDGSSSSSASFLHTYTASGDYTVTLTATDAANVSSTTSYHILVLPDPHASIVLSPATITSGTLITIGSNVTGGLPPYTYHWNFGDGNQSTQPSPKHTYASPGSYLVTLKVTDAAGYSVSTSFNVTVVKGAPHASSSSSSSSTGYLMLGAGIVAGIVIGVVVGLVVASRRRKPPAP
ncbi:MAG: PKD domain-containing protein [Methanomassiliicoccales archaeon]